MSLAAPAAVIAQLSGAICRGPERRPDARAERPTTAGTDLWNATGPIGTAANYAPLQWCAGLIPSLSYTTDGTSNFPTPNNGGYTRIASMGGHPGEGAAQTTDNIDRFTIAAYTVQAGQAGTYGIAGSSLTFQDPAAVGVILRVYVNNTQKARFIFMSGGASTNFDTPLGALNAGDTVYVAVGAYALRHQRRVPAQLHAYDGRGASAVRGAGGLRHGLPAGNDAKGWGGRRWPSDGWNFLWNPTSAVGTAANYAPLQWVANTVPDNLYTVDGSDAFPRPNNGGFIQLLSNGGAGGHPGEGARADQRRDRALARSRRIPCSQARSGKAGITGSKW